jgi:hypothetical protein
MGFPFLQWFSREVAKEATLSKTYSFLAQSRAIKPDLKHAWLRDVQT